MRSNFLPNLQRRDHAAILHTILCQLYYTGDPKKGAWHHVPLNNAPAFCAKAQFVINTGKHTVILDKVPILKIAEQFEPNLTYDKLSYQDILDHYPFVTFGEMNKNHISHSFKHTLEVEGLPIAQSSED